MLKNFLKFSAGALGIIILGLLFFYGVSYLQNKKNIPPQEKKSDEIVITELPTGEKLVENRTERYSVRINKDFKAEPPINSNDNGITILTTQNVKCNIYFNKIQNKANLSPLDYFKNSYGELINTYQITTGNIKNINATIISINSEGENGYSRNIYLPANDILYEIIAYSDKPLTSECINNLIKITESAQF